VELKRFDLLFVRGRSLIGRVIRSVTDSPYSHVAVVWGPGEIADTDWLRPLDRRPQSVITDPFDVYRYRGTITLEQAAMMQDFFREHEGTGYDFIQSLSHGLYLLTGWPIIDDAKRFNCSEFVDRMFKKAYIDLYPVVDGHVTPGDLARSDNLFKVS
jgi:hypothetical protein